MGRVDAVDRETVTMKRDIAPIWPKGNRLLGYDPELRRLWVGGQRLHHGATGVALAGVAVASLMTRRSPRGLAYLIAGSAMVAHDWKDRSVWFQRGPQSDA
jgi:hypothetical protein